jgi:hypothetical protein
MMGPAGMAMMLKTMGIMAFIATAVLLGISFLVLAVARKTEEQWLKVFGHAVTILLWFSAALVFSTVISALTMRCDLKSPMIQRMHGMRGQRQQMMQQQTPMMPQGRAAMPEKAEAQK